MLSTLLYFNKLFTLFRRVSLIPIKKTNAQDGHKAEKKHLDILPIEKTQNVVQSRPNQYAQYHYLSENSVGRKKVEQSHNLSALWTKIRFFNGSIHF